MGLLALLAPLSCGLITETAVHSLGKLRGERRLRESIFPTHWQGGLSASSRQAAIPFPFVGSVFNSFPTECFFYRVKMRGDSQFGTYLLRYIAQYDR